MTHLQIDEDVGHRGHEAAQLGQFFEFDVGAVHLQALEFGPQVVIVLCREGFVEQQYLPKLLHGFQFGQQAADVRLHLQVVHKNLPHGTKAMPEKQLAYGVETYFSSKFSG